MPNSHPAMMNSERGSMTVRKPDHLNPGQAKKRQPVRGASAAGGENPKALGMEEM
jgi:hypothetical protein